MFKFYKSYMYLFSNYINFFVIFIVQIFDY
mgnify:CR=1 FL=1